MKNAGDWIEWKGRIKNNDDGHATQRAVVLFAAKRLRESYMAGSQNPGQDRGRARKVLLMEPKSR